ncbi:enolase-phosphatase E1-like isoform X1 [Teleopsis dalmanni]|uniref:enolase-phosphatase E1-like isoform X1 n=2 Tax=Teleopsis dalmanni TaxID=139649 RepID=UPI0018CDBF0C|nr:enolase-phosphatase E1-like isoform X1 [Teleopsis dalmanni]
MGSAGKRNSAKRRHKSVNMQATSNENNESERKSSRRRKTVLNVQDVGGSNEVAENVSDEINLKLSTLKKLQNSVKNTPSVRRSTRAASKITSEFVETATPSSSIAKMNEILENSDMKNISRSGRKTISRKLDYSEIIASKGLRNKLNFETNNEVKADADNGEDKDDVNDNATNKENNVQSSKTNITELLPQISTNETKIKNIRKNSMPAKVLTPSGTVNEELTLHKENAGIEESLAAVTNEKVKGSGRKSTVRSSVTPLVSKSNKKNNKKVKKNTKKNSELNLKMANLSMETNTDSDSHTDNNDNVEVINKSSNKVSNDAKQESTENVQKQYIKHISADDEFENLDTLPKVINENSSENTKENELNVTIDKIDNSIGKSVLIAKTESNSVETFDLIDDEDINFIPLLVISDDEDSIHTPVKNTSITSVNKNITLNESPSNENKDLAIPLDTVTETPTLLETPKAKLRNDYNPHPTPYSKSYLLLEKSVDKKQVKSEGKELVNSAIEEVECTPKSTKTYISAKKKKILKAKAVTFNSADNRITKIADIDEIINKSVKKQDADQQVLLKNESHVNIKRRKRSFDEMKQTSINNDNDESKPTPNKISKPDIDTASSTRSTPQKIMQKATKLPNFAAIHQKQFNKMENLTEYVTRKTERAKNLINSGVKTLPSASKVAPFKFNGNAQAGVPSKALKSINFYGKTTTPGKTEPKAEDKTNILLPTDFPKSTDRSQLRGINSSSKKLLPIVRKVEHVPAKPKAAKKIDLNEPVKTISENKPDEEQNLLARLPNPRLGIMKQQMTANKSVTELKSLKPVAQITPLKPSNNTKTSRPREESHISAIDKATLRRERHMNMYKGRVGGAHKSNSAKDAEIIRGVRSNRRFELQMQYRNQIKD